MANRFITSSLASKSLAVFLAVSMSASCVPVAAYAESSANQRSTASADTVQEKSVDQILDEAHQAVLTGQAKDITRLWTAGAYEISQEGLYQVTEDISVTEPLNVSVPQGEVAILDLKGHKVTFEGASESLVQVNDEGGTLLIVDSVAWVDALEADAQDDQQEAQLDSALLMGAGCLSTVEQLVKVSQPENAQIDDDSYAVILSNVALGLAEGVDENTATSEERLMSGVYADQSKVALVDGIASDWGALDGCFDLASADQRSFTFLKDFKVQQSLRVWVNDAQEGTVCATVQEGFDADDAQAMVLVPQQNGLAYAFDGESSAFVLRQQESESSQQAVQPSAAVSQGQTTVRSDAVVQEVADNVGSLETQSVEGTDLNALWAASGMSTALTITEGGTYYLSADLTTSTRLIINAAGQDVTIDFQGHTFTCEALDVSGEAISVKAAASATFTGGSVYYHAGPVKYAISSAADSLNVADMDIRIRPDDNHLSLSEMLACGVGATKGQVSVIDTTIDIDMTNQGNSTVVGNSYVKNGPRGIYLEKGVTSAEVSGCSVTVRNSCLVGLTDASNMDTMGHAFGIYSLTTKSVVVNDSSFDVTSALGAAIGIYGKNVSLEGEKTSVKLSAAQQTIGLYAAAQNAISLNAEFSLTHGAAVGSQLDTALYGKVANGFVVGSGFSGSDLPVYVGTSEDSANGADVRIGTFAQSVSDSDKARLAAIFTNAFGSESACSVAYDQDGLYFKLQEGKAPVGVVREGETSWYANFTEALAAAESGDTLMFTGDYGDITFDKKTTATDSYTLDLNGNTINSLLFSSNAALTVKNGSIDGMNPNNNSAVANTGTGSLALADLNVSARSVTSLGVWGILISGKGSVSATNCNISVSSGRTGAYGIQQTSASGGALTLTGGSLQVQATASDVKCYGVLSNATSNAIMVDCCPVKVSGVDEELRAFDIRSQLTVMGNSQDTTIQGESVNLTKETYGIYAQKATAKVSLSNVSIDMQAQKASSYEAWCLSCGAATATDAISVALEGACSFTSSTNTGIRTYATQLNLGSSFANAAQTPIVVESRGLTDVVFATLDGGNAQSASAAFAPYDQGAFAGWTAQGQDANLAWTRDAVVRNSQTGTTYSTLQEAFDAAATGDTLTLMRDEEVRGTLNITHPVTLDVNGHTLTVQAQAGASLGADGAGGALALKANGLITFTDTAQTKGLIDLYMGSTAESDTTAKYGYAGVAVSEATQWVLDGVCVHVTYSGTSTALPDVTMRGVCLTDGSAALKNGAQLVVKAAKQDGSFGAATVSGIHAVGEGATEVSVDASSSIRVENNSKLQLYNAATWPGSSLDLGTGSAKTSSNLVEFNVSEDSELYAEIQEAFRKNAKFDGSVDADGQENNLNVYYVTGLTLDSGLMIWAYSDVVPQDKVGLQSSIVATHIFIRSGNNTPLEALGVSCDADFAGAVSVAGAVDAATSVGHSFGMLQNSKAAWTVQEDAVTASCTPDSTFKKLSTDLFDLSDYMYLGEGVQDVTYPSDSKYRSVGEVKSTALPIAQLDTDYDTNVVPNAGNYEGDQSDTDGLQVSVNFSNLRDSQGALLEDRSVSLDYGKTLSEAGIEKLMPSDYQIGSTTYRFVGWKVKAGVSLGQYCYNPDYLYESLAIDADLKANTSTVEISAVYVPVEQDEHLAIFDVEYARCAYAVKNGERATYADCFNTSDAVVPSRLVTETGYTFVFKGWAEGQLGTSLYEEGDQVYDSLLPLSSTDVIYTGLFEKNLSRSSVTLAFNQPSTDGTYKLASKVIQYVDWTQDYMDQVQSVAPIGSTYVENNVEYTLVGWSSRVSDKEPYYDESNPIAGRMSDTGVLYAVYETLEQQATVNFYVDGQLYSTISNVAYGDTLQNAFQHSSNNVKPTSSDSSYSFRGWNTSADATSILTTSTLRVGSLANEDKVVNLYAIWQEETPTVTFYDEDKTTVVETVSVKRGTTVEDELGETVKPTGDKRDLFLYWVDAEGNTFSTAKTKVTASMSVYAVYTKTSSGTGTISGDTNKSSSSGSSSSSAESATKASTAGSTSSSTTSATLSAAKTSSSSLASASGVSATAASASGTSSVTEAATKSDAATSENKDANEPVALADSVAGAAMSDQLEASEESDPLDDTGGTVLFYVLFALALLAGGSFLWWFLHRNKKDEDASEDLFDKMNAEDTIRF